MAKMYPLGVRFSPEEKAALEEAARSDQRPASALARLIVAEWLRKNGWLSKDGG